MVVKLCQKLVGGWLCVHVCAHMHNACKNPRSQTGGRIVLQCPPEFLALALLPQDNCSLVCLDQLFFFFK